MVHDEITLYYPGDGVEAGSNKATYKGIKEFRQLGNGIISFKTTKHGTITTDAAWRLKVGVEGNVDDADAQAPAAAGNRAARRY